MQEATKIIAVRGYGTGMERLFLWALSHIPREGDMVDFDKKTCPVQRVWFDADHNEIRIHLEQT